MQAIGWQLRNQLALLRTVGFSGQIDLAQASYGLTHLVAGGKPWHAARLLGLNLHADSQDGSVRPALGSVRDHALTLTMETPAPQSLRINAQWLSVEPELGEKFIAAVDLLVSVETRAYDVLPAVTVQSTLPTWESLCLTATTPLHYQPLSHTGEDVVALRPDNSLGCLLFRQAGLNVSYVEMIHPADFCESELRQSGLAKNESCLTHRLFGSALEKGVMLRSRLRGMFIPRIDDMAIAAECYAAFSVSEPLLAT